MIIYPKKFGDIKMIYLDNAATTPVSDEVIEIVIKYLKEKYYNPSALYGAASEISKDILNARKGIADLLSVNPDEIYFTGSGTESDNVALLNTSKRIGSRIIISAAEHAAIYNTAMELKQRGFDIVLAPVDRFGRVIEDGFISLLDDNTSLVSIIHVNNETGAVNDVEKLSKITKEYNKRIIFHSDGVQAFGKRALDLKASNIDLYSFSGHKISAPKGIGGLYIRKGVGVRPSLYGGGQENNFRASTENVAGIMALDYAAHKSILNYINNYNTMLQLLRKTADFIVKSIPNTIINSNLDGNSAQNIISFAFKKIRGEVLLHSLESYGIIVGTGSACSSKKGSNRIGEAINLPKDYHNGIIRVSISPDTKEEDLVFAAEMIVKEYNKLSIYG
jgi:cysteine desulfurase